ncbi:universal stress protein [Streptomyces sp. NPDC007808]|uniref:universal stress protein n=1 Tax=Streptomyces sp. NPDC007808 TaxID=3364779 RepID=UPI0036743E21
MELPEVMGVDGSEPSPRAVHRAVDEAARHAVAPRLVYASLWERCEQGEPRSYGGPQSPSGQLTADTVVPRAAERARRRAPDVQVSVDVVPDEPVNALLNEALHAFAVVTGSRGRGGLSGLLPGSVGRTVAARAPGPMSVVRGDRAGPEGTHERILLAAADPAVAGEATRFAFREAETRRCTLDVVRPYRAPAHRTADHVPLTGEPAHHQEEQASALIDAVLHDARVDHPGVRVRRTTARGPAHRLPLHRSAAADLVVIGARRRSGRFGLQLGRVGHTLLHHADAPVAVVPHPE